MTATSHQPPYPPPRPRDERRLRELIGILRCPLTGRKLVWKNSHKVALEDGSGTWPVQQFRPLLHPELAAVNDRGQHVSHPIGAEAQAIIDSADGLVLNLAAGGTRDWNPKVVEAETAIFRNTDVIADVHRLPFVDGAFAAVVALNAFEHFRNPFQAASEIARVLRPGGRLFIHTAFLQPLHEQPYHYFNATKFGVLEWFSAFTPETVRVSDNFNPFFTIAWLAHEIGICARQHLTAEDAACIAQMSLEDFGRLWLAADRHTHPVWKAFTRLPQEAQEGLAAGFQFVGRRR